MCVPLNVEEVSSKIEYFVFSAARSPEWRQHLHNNSKLNQDSNLIVHYKFTSTCKVPLAHACKYSDHFSISLLYGEMTLDIIILYYSDEFLTQQVNTWLN